MTIAPDRAAGKVFYKLAAAATAARASGGRTVRDGAGGARSQAGQPGPRRRRSTAWEISEKKTRRGRGCGAGERGARVTRRGRRCPRPGGPTGALPATADSPESLSKTRRGRGCGAGEREAHASQAGQRISRGRLAEFQGPKEVLVVRPTTFPDRPRHPPGRALGGTFGGAMLRHLPRRAQPNPKANGASRP